MDGNTIALITIENEEPPDAIEDPAREELVQVEPAPHRVESGEFAFCESCGKEIHERRLRIDPSSTLCTRCAQEA